MTHMNIHTLLRPAALALVAAVASGCGGTSDTATTGQGDGSTSSGQETGGDTGTASFAVTDAPSDAVSHVYVTFDRIAVQPADGERITLELPEPRQVDLLAYQGDNAAALLEEAELPAGQYNWIRLYVVGGSPDSQVEDKTGGIFGLYVPGNQPQSRNPNQRWIQLSSPFFVPAGGSADFVIDVDLRKALVKLDIPPVPEPFYMIRPSLRIVDRNAVGTITGTVDAALVEHPDCQENAEGQQANAVYLFEGAGAQPGDVYLDEEGEPKDRADESNPVTTANVTLNSEGLYRYTLGFVEPGAYTLAFTCDAIADARDSDDALSFSAPVDVSVAADQIVNVDLGN